MKYQIVIVIYFAYTGDSVEIANNTRTAVANIRMILRILTKSQRCERGKIEINLIYFCMVKE